MYSSDEQARLKRRVQIEAELERCMSLLIRDYKPDKIILFGSMVHGVPARVPTSILSWSKARRSVFLTA